MSARRLPRPWLLLSPAALLKVLSRQELPDMTDPALQPKPPGLAR